MLGLNNSGFIPPIRTEMQFIRADIKVGGSTFWRMMGPHGVMHGRAKYIKLSNPSKIIYTQQFVDDQERISRHPLAQTWPETMLTTIDLSVEELNRTRVTITWEPYGEASKDEIETFKSARGGMTQGWTGSFDKLEGCLEKQS